MNLVPAILYHDQHSANNNIIVNTSCFWVLMNIVQACVRAWGFDCIPGCGGIRIGMQMITKGTCTAQEPMSPAEAARAWPLGIPFSL